MSLRQMGSIKRSSETMMIWCGPQVVTNGVTVSQTNAYGALAEQLDESAIEWGGSSYASYYPTPASSGYNTNFYSRPIALGSPNWNIIGAPVKNVANKYNNSGNVLLFTVQYENQDDYDPMDNYASICAMRFRHMNNTTTNTLFIDNHVESRPLLSVTAKDVSITTGIGWGAAPGAGE
jgi:prepilin-type processing-associated H-X9-DG protein